MKTINSSRLKELREHSGLSQGELAKLIDVHTSQISRWENGERQPSLNQLMTIARALGVTLDYLLNANLTVHFQFRSKKTLEAEKKKAIDRTLLDAEMQIHSLYAAYKLSETLPKPFTLKSDFVPQQLTAICAQMRGILKLNQRVTFDELKQALTELNVHVFEWVLPWELSGLSYRNALAVIVINRNHSKERKLFTLAHEFAHVLFHLSKDSCQTMVSVIASNRDPEEKEANAFASELLMPSNDVEQVIRQAGQTVKHIETLDSIARCFNVSREAMFYRLVEKGIFKWEEKQLYLRKSAAQPEPPETRVQDIDEQIAPEFLRLVLNLHDAKKISTGKLKEWFFTDRITLEEYLTNRAREVEEVLEFEGA